jgi:hypothetical protein
MQSPKRCVLKYEQCRVLDKNTTVDNIQKHSIFTFILIVLYVLFFLLSTIQMATE